MALAGKSVDAQVGDDADDRPPLRDLGAAVERQAPSDRFAAAELLASERGIDDHHPRSVFVVVAGEEAATA